MNRSRFLVREMLRVVAARRVSSQGLTVVPRRTLAASVTGESTTVASPPAVNTDVPGLGENCVDVPNAPVGPGAAKNKEYKNPEYFCYNVDTIGEAEVELAKYRLPVPSNKRPFS